MTGGTSTAAGPLRKTVTVTVGFDGWANRAINMYISLEGDFRNHVLQILHYTEEGTQGQLDSGFPKIKQFSSPRDRTSSKSPLP